MNPNKKQTTLEYILHFQNKFKLSEWVILSDIRRYQRLRYENFVYLLVSTLLKRRVLEVSLSQKLESKLSLITWVDTIQLTKLIIMTIMIMGIINT